MAAVFRTLVSAQEPITPKQRKKPSPSKEKDIEQGEQTPATLSSGKRFNISRRRKHKKQSPQEPVPDNSGLEATREPSEDAPTYFNHPMEKMEPREARQKDKRDSYVTTLHDIAQNAPSPDDKGQKGPKSETDVTSPKSFFDDDSSSEVGRPRASRLLKKSMSSLKVSTSNFLARSRGQGGGLGSGSMAAFGGNMGLEIGGIEQERHSPVIGSPTGFRRLVSGQDMAEFSDGMSSRSPSLVDSPSTPSMTAGKSQRGKLGKVPSTSNLGDWFWGRQPETSPTKQHPSDAEKESAADLRGKPPAYLARAQRRHQTALSVTAKRSAAPSPRPGDAVEEDDEPVSDSSSFYMDDAEPEAVPAPLNIVKRRSQQHLRARRAADGKIERTPSFLRRIEALGEQRRRLQHSTSHPALRGGGVDDSGSLVGSTSGPLAAEIAQQKLILADAPPMPPLPATAPLTQRPFHPRRPSIERAVHDFFSPSDPTLTPEKALRDRLVGNAFMQQLRRDAFGLEPLRRAKKEDVKHPNHPLKWETESLMCTGKHNPLDVPGELGDGEIPEGMPTVMRHVDLPAPRLKNKSSFTSAADLDSHIIDAAKKCGLCGRFCCHFIELLNYLHSPVTTPKPTAAAPSTTNVRYADIAEERNRIHASAKVMRLKQEQPNGLDPYDTFVTCTGCGQEVCSRCAKRCGNEGCGCVICVRCGVCGCEG